MRKRLAAASFFSKGTESDPAPFGKEEVKKLLSCFTWVFILLLSVSACASKQHDRSDHDNGHHGGDPVDFKSFRLVQTDMMAQRRVYEGYKTDNGVHLEHYISTNEWDDTISGHTGYRDTVRKIDGDEKLFQRLCGLFGHCGIKKWADFHGHDPQVLDGTGMSFKAVLADGTEVNADGINSFPEGFSAFAQELHKLITTEKISSVRFTDGTYEVTLPESWVGTVTAEFSEGRVAFFVEKNDGGELTFFIIDNDKYGYSSDRYKGRIEVGRLVSGEEIRFITARDNYSIASYASNVSGDALAIWENYESDKLAMIESLRSVNGYAFYPEDGTVLYYAKARDMADKARTLWLSLNFAGEYPGSAKPIRVKRKNYVPMFPPYDRINTVEGVRKEFLKVFSEGFTDKTLDRAIADKELIEYKGDVYVVCKKRKGEASYSSRVDCVWDEGDGKFTVVIAVKMPPSGSMLYVDLPTEKNAAGEFVFSDYPYWEKSE